MVIESGANGFFTVVDVTLNSFKLDGKAGDCNFIQMVKQLGAPAQREMVMSMIVLFHLLVVVAAEPKELRMLI